MAAAAGEGRLGKRIPQEMTVAKMTIAVEAATGDKVKSVLTLVVISGYRKSTCIISCQRGHGVICILPQLFTSINRSFGRGGTG